MGDIAAVAERLRLVRQARGKFLRLWAIEQSMIEPLVERLAHDLLEPSPFQPPAESGAGPDSSQHPDAPLVDES